MSKFLSRHVFAIAGVVAAVLTWVAHAAIQSAPSAGTALAPLPGDPGAVLLGLFTTALLVGFGWLADRARRRLVGERRRLRALVDSHPDMVTLVNAEGLYLDVHIPGRNRSFLDESAFLGKYADEVFEPEFAAEHAERRRRVLETGMTESWEYVRPAGDAMRHLEARFVPCGGKEVLITVRDITDRIRLERDVIASAETERSRVGRDLHDGLSQQLAGTKLILESLSRELLAEGSPSRFAAERAVQQIGLAIEQTRDLARGLSPVPPGATLVDALEHIVGDTERLLGVECSFDASGGPFEVAQSAEAHLYRIAQEAMTNAVKHGRADHIWLTLAHDRDARHLVMTIANDGADFIERSPAPVGMGLRIMRYRAQAIEGDLSVRRRETGGTVVRCRCPLVAGPARTPAVAAR